jgi:hypothetical protein
MTWFTSEEEADPIAIKAYLDGLALTTINAVSAVPIGSAKVIVIVNGT